MNVSNESGVNTPDSKIEGTEKTKAFTSASNVFSLYS